MAINIRASSIASIIDCPLRGLSIVLGLVKPLPSTAPAAIGSACHASTAAHDKLVVESLNPKPYDTVDVLVEMIRNPDEEVNWGMLTIEEAERRALGVHTRYCTDIAPQMQYTEIELGLTPMLIDVEGVEIELTGTLDRVQQKPAKENPPSASEGWDYSGKNTTNSTNLVSLNAGKSGIADLKTGARACSQSPGKHKGQLAVYEILYEHTTGRECLLDPAIIQLQTSSEYEVDVKTVQNARTALVGDGLQIGFLQHIARMLKSGDFIGNPSSWLCSERYCPLYKSCIFK